jgi:arylsulfatase A-like enzyme
MIARREFLGSVAASLAAQPAAPRPNFVIILTDDHGYADLGCHGAVDLKTPHIDALAASGARMTNWYAMAPMCAPSRASLLTGRYPQRCGVALNGLELPPSERTVASLLKQAGYVTGITGKWHLGSRDETAPTGHGFDSFYGFHSGCIDFFSHRYYWGEPKTVNYHDLWRNRTEIFEDGQYFTELVAREATRFIAENRARPFFLYVAFNAPHYPMHAPRKYLERFPKLDLERRTYGAMIAAVDDGIGEIVSTLRRHGLLENTMIFFGADNGATREPRAGLNQKPPGAGHNTPYRGYKFSLFDGGMHVPGILTWPARIPRGQTIREIGCHLDLLPTICAAAGAPVARGVTIDGRDILPMVAERATSPHDALCWASGGQTAVRRGPWKLVRNGFLADGPGRQRFSGDDEVFLSNLDEDPGESRNLRRQRPEVVDELLTLAAAWSAQFTE